METKNLIISANAKLASKRKAFKEAEMKNKRAKDEILAAECELEVMKSLGEEIEMETKEAKNEIITDEFEKEFTNRTCQFKEIFERFPHLLEQMIKLSEAEIKAKRAKDEILASKYELEVIKSLGQEVEMEAREAKNEVMAAQRELQVLEKTFEKMFVRFPHIPEKIFKLLNFNSLYKCKRVHWLWKKFISENKFILKNLSKKEEVRFIESMPKTLVLK